MMGYTAPSKAAIKRALKVRKPGTYGPEQVEASNLLDFYRNVQETSFFGSEAQVPGENTVVGPDAYTNRKWFATLTVDANGTVTGIR